ncbi:MAG: hypothetical protein WC521_01325 [Bdellovibrionales bacterium]
MAILEVILVKPSENTELEHFEKTIKYHQSFRQFGFGPMGVSRENVRRAIVDPSESNKAYVVVATSKKAITGIHTLEAAEKLCKCGEEIITIVARSTGVSTTLYSLKTPANG